VSELAYRYLNQSFSYLIFLQMLSTVVGKPSLEGGKMIVSQVPVA
jgi:hypothetical protein